MSFKLDNIPLVGPWVILIGLSVVTPAFAAADRDLTVVANDIADTVVDEPQADYAFTLTNDTSVVMLEFYASPQTASEWEEDFLGGNTIQSNGDWTIITLPGDRGCIYDFLAIFADGDKLEKYGINVCELETHTYYED